MGEAAGGSRRIMTEDKKEKTRNINIRYPVAMVDQMDLLQKEQHYAGRSEIFRCAVREFLLRKEREKDE